jgi:hypothetical protein
VVELDEFCLFLRDGVDVLLYPKGGSATRLPRVRSGDEIRVEVDLHARLWRFTTSAGWSLWLEDVLGWGNPEPTSVVCTLELRGFDESLEMTCEGLNVDLEMHALNEENEVRPEVKRREEEALARAEEAARIERSKVSKRTRH